MALGGASLVVESSAKPSEQLSTPIGENLLSLPRRQCIIHSSFLGRSALSVQEPHGPHVAASIVSCKKQRSYA